MVPIDLARKNRAGLIGIATDGDDRLHRLVEKLGQMLRAVVLEVDADFVHDPDGQRMNVARRFAAGTGHPEATLRGGAKKSFGEMAAAGVSGAENENEREGVIGVHVGGWG